MISLKINYDDFGQLVKQSRFDTDKSIIETKNKYDEAGRLTNISHVGNQKTYADYDITWDNGNRITDFDFTYLNGPPKKNKSNYRYDKTSQLTSATYNFMPEESYQYDPNGNRTQATIHDQKISYKTASHNRLISDNNNRYEYDLEGNRTKSASKDGEIKYYWDNRNRLIKIETPRGTIEYFYDYLNRLVLRKQGETTITFIHDGWQIILQFDNDKPTHRYLWGTKQDELICDNDNWTLGDHLNTIRDIVKSDGTVTDHLEYNSFGKIISATKNDSQLQCAYTGKLTDKASELQWNINRWYDANVGRWVSEDPIGFRAGDSNLTRYVRNGVIYSFDKNGLWKITRNGTSRAFAISDTGDTVNSLATTIGLNVNEWKKWLEATVPPLRKSSGLPVEQTDTFAVLCPKQEVRIPNSILAIWVGDLGSAGRVLYFDTNVADLRTLGFAVHTEITDQYDYDPTFINPNPIINALPAGTQYMATYTNFLTGPVGNESQHAAWYIMKRFEYGTKEMKLHGTYVVGHGSVTGFYGGAGPLGSFYFGEHPISVQYASIVTRLEYQLGAVVLQVGDGASGSVLGGGGPGGVFFGITGTYYPTISFPGSIKQLWTGGQQGTKP